MRVKRRQAEREVNKEEQLKRIEKNTREEGEAVRDGRLRSGEEGEELRPAEREGNKGATTEEKEGMKMTER